MNVKKIKKEKKKKKKKMSAEWGKTDKKKLIKNV